MATARPAKRASQALLPAPSPGGKIKEVPNKNPVISKTESLLVILPSSNFKEVPPFHFSVRYKRLGSLSHQAQFGFNIDTQAGFGKKFIPMRF